MSRPSFSQISLYIIEFIIEFLSRREKFEFHLTCKRIFKKYWEILNFKCFGTELISEPLNESSISSLPLRSLLEIVKLTKNHFVLSKLASVSISLLVKLKYNFCNEDLSHTILSNSDLSTGLFQDVDFSYSNLENCDFTRAFISNCNFFKASLKNTQFGVRTVTGHLHTITCLALSEDNKLLVSAGYDRLIKLWDLPSFKLLKTLQTSHNGAISALCLSSDGGLLISAEQDIRLWDLNDGQTKYLKGHDKKVTGLTMSRGNGFFASCGLDGLAKIWNTQDCKVKKVLDLASPVLSIMMAPDGKTCVVGLKTSEVVLFDNKCKVINRQTFLTAVRSVFIDLRFIVAGTDSGVVSLRDKNNTLIREYLGHSDVVTCVRIVKSFLYSAGGEQDCSIRKWDLMSDCCLDVILGHTSGINSFVISGLLCISAGKDKIIRVNQIRSQDLPADWVECLTIMEDGSVAMGSSRSGVRIWKQAQADQHSEKTCQAALVKTHPVGSRVMSLASQQTTVAAGCWDMNIYIFHETLCNTLIGHCDAVLSLQFQDDCLFSGGADGTIKIWLWEEDLCLNTLNIEAGYVHRVVGNSRFAVAATGCSLTRLVVWDLQLDSTLFYAVQRGRVKALVLSDEYFVTGGSESPAVEVWSFTGDLLQKFSNHSKPITDLLLLNDQVLTSSEDKFIFLWAWKTDTVLYKFFGFTSSAFRSVSEETIVACENKGNSVQVYKLQDFSSFILDFRTLSMFECRNSSFRGSLGLDFWKLEELENNINYIR